MARKKMKLKDAIQGYMLRCQSKGLSFRTREWYEQKLTCFCQYLQAQLQITDLASVTWHLCGRSRRCRRAAHPDSGDGETDSRRRL